MRVIIIITTVKVCKIVSQKLKSFCQLIFNSDENKFFLINIFININN